MRVDDLSSFSFTELEQQMMNDKFGCKRKYLDDPQHTKPFSLNFQLRIGKYGVLPLTLFRQNDLNNKLEEVHSSHISHHEHYVFIGLFATTDIPYLSLQIGTLSSFVYHNVNKGTFTFQ